MSTSFDIDPALLTDYLRGDCSPEDRARVEQWLAQSDEHWRMLTQARVALASIVVPDRPDFDVEQFTNDMLARVRSLDAAQGSQDVSRWRARHAVWAIGAAGCAAVIILSVLGVRHNPHNISQHTYTTQAGQRSTVRLTDGSTMMLAPATSVTVSADGAFVTGEAYFTVAAHTSRPFVVRTENAEVRVLGTTFSVRRYPGDARSRVVVEDGKVALRLARQPAKSSDIQTDRTQTKQIVLAAGMMGIATDSTITGTSGVAVENYTAWTQGRLVFQKTPLRDVIDEVARVYGAELRIADTTLAGQPMTMTVSVETATLPQVLEIIGLTYHARFTRVGNAFVLVRGRVTIGEPQRRISPYPEKQYGK